MKMDEQHYLPCPICGQSCRTEVALGYAEKSSVRNVVAFGHGFYGVDIGTLGDHPAVFIIPNEKPGQVGERVPLDLQLPLERELLPDDWTVLLFPTRDRCKEVADALVGSRMDKWKDELIQSAAHGGGTESGNRATFIGADWGLSDSMYGDYTPVTVRASSRPSDAQEPDTDRGALLFAIFRYNLVEMLHAGSWHESTLKRAMELADRLDAETTDVAELAKLVATLRSHPFPSDPAQEPEAVAHVSRQIIERLKTHSAANALLLTKPDPNTVPLYARPVSLDREAVARAVRNGVYFDGDDREVKGFDDAADNVLALIEGRT